MRVIFGIVVSFFIAIFALADDYVKVDDQSVATVKTITINDVKTVDQLVDENARLQQNINTYLAQVDAWRAKIDENNQQMQAVDMLKESDAGTRISVDEVRDSTVVVNNPLLQDKLTKPGNP